MVDNLCSKDVKKAHSALLSYVMKYIADMIDFEKYPQYQELKFQKGVEKLSKVADVHLEEVSPKQGSKMFEKASQIEKEPGEYNLYNKNCSIVARRIAKAAFEKLQDNTSTYDPIKKLLKCIPVGAHINIPFLDTHKVIFDKLAKERKKDDKNIPR